MRLKKDGVSVTAVHPADIARFKSLGYVEVEGAKPSTSAPKPDKDFAQEQQDIVEEVIEPEKKARKKRAANK
jgi:hypothetical protein